MHWAFSILPRSRNPHRVVRCLQCSKGHSCATEEQMGCLQERQTTEICPLIYIYFIIEDAGREVAQNSVICLRFSAATKSSISKHSYGQHGLFKGSGQQLQLWQFPVRCLIQVKWDCNFFPCIFPPKTNNIYTEETRERKEREKLSKYIT